MRYMAGIGCFVAAALLLVTAIWSITIFLKKPEQQQVEKAKENEPRPQLKPLTEEQIEAIHARGKITPAEKVQEWISMGVCAPGDGMGGASWRCKKFKYNCYDCLVDYANEIGDEFISFETAAKEVAQKHSNEDFKMFL